MKIDNIRLSYKQTTKDGHHTATVLLNHTNGSLTLRARAEKQTNAASDDVDRRLISDAIRQLRRMPEFRRDASVVTIPDSAWPSSNPKA